jgi:hypothetical protein
VGEAFTQIRAGGIKAYAALAQTRLAGRVSIFRGVKSFPGGCSIGQRYRQAHS